MKEELFFHYKDIQEKKTISKGTVILNDSENGVDVST